MSVATHLLIDLAEYDARIRTFIPDYDEMLDRVAELIPRGARTIVDLGTGTGELAARCLEKARPARITGIDSDPEILKAAQRRIGARGTFVCDTFVRAPLPACDAVVASFALHHVRTRAAKAKFFQRIHAALRPRGVFVTADCHPAAHRTLARQQFEAWRSHLCASYTARKADAFLAAWAHDDVYVPLETEMSLMQQSGFAVEVAWRKGAFAVLIARRKQARRD